VRRSIKLVIINTLGLKEQLIFPEIDYEEVDQVQVSQST
jgi:hypothetical protein